MTCQDAHVWRKSCQRKSSSPARLTAFFHCAPQKLDFAGGLDLTEGESGREIAA
jgi:hypothetical protein